jgi:hypothetical protein
MLFRSTWCTTVAHRSLASRHRAYCRTLVNATTDDGLHEHDGAGLGDCRGDGQAPRRRRSVACPRRFLYALLRIAVQGRIVTARCRTRIRGGTTDHQRQAAPIRHHFMHADGRAGLGNFVRQGYMVMWSTSTATLRLLAAATGPMRIRAALAPRFVAQATFPAGRAARNGRQWRTGRSRDAATMGQPFGEDFVTAAAVRDGLIAVLGDQPVDPVGHSQAGARWLRRQTLKDPRDEPNGRQWARIIGA